MIAAASDYGPFAPVVGYAGAVMAAGGALYYLWGGKLEKWRPPDEDIPGGAQKFVLLLCGVGMVIQWFLAVPEQLERFVYGVAGLAIAAVGCFLGLSFMLGAHIYIKKEATGTASTKDVRLLGGRKLLPEAEKQRKKAGISIQTLLAGAAYDPDLLWSRKDRQGVKLHVLLLFILTLTLGTWALSGASFAVQVRLTKKAASSVIETNKSPGLK